MDTSSDIQQYLVKANRVGSLDALHDAYLSLYVAYGRVDLPALVRRTRQRRIDGYRRSRRYESLSYEPSDDSISPDCVAEQRELGNACREAIAKLPSVYRTVIERHYIGGQTPAEIAEHLGCSRDTVYTRLRRARALMHKNPAIAQLKALFY